MRQCNICKGTWVSQSPKCIHCGSEDIYIMTEEETKKFIESGFAKTRQGVQDER